jgi:hypothetical protein
MGLDISRAQREQRDELADMNAQYLKKRREMIQSQNQDLDQIKENFIQERDKLEQQNEAVVNHIKISNEAEHQNLREQNAEKLRQQQEYSRQQLYAQKRNSEDSIKSLKLQEQEVKGQTEQRIQELDQRERSVRTKQDEATRQYIASQQNVQTKAREEARKSVEEVYKKGSDLRKDILQKNENELREIEAKYQKEIQAKRAQEQSLMNAENSKATERSQPQNRERGLERLQSIVAGALIVPKIRRSTRPTRASKEERLSGKKRQSSVKINRRPIDYGKELP